jgi:hypothetical protein
MFDPISAVLHVGASVANLFARNQQTEQTALVLKARQEQDAKIQQFQSSIQQKQLKLDEDRLKLQMLQIRGQAKEVELLGEQIESQRVQIEIATKQLNLQLHEVINSQRSLDIQAQSLKTQSEMLEVLSLQKTFLSIIALIALIWLGIQVFPTISPWLKMGADFALKEIIILKDGFTSLLELLFQSILQTASSIMKFVVELTSSIISFGVWKKLKQKMDERHIKRCPNIGHEKSKH